MEEQVEYTTANSAHEATRRRQAEIAAKCLAHLNTEDCDGATFVQSIDGERVSVTIKRLGRPMMSARSYREWHERSRAARA